MVMQSLLNMFGIVSLEQGSLSWCQLASIYENSHATCFSGEDRIHRHCFGTGQLLEPLPLLLLLHLILLLLEL